MSHLGAAIKAFRKKANLTQDQLAEMLGTTKAAVSRYESGKRTPRYDQIIQIADALQISPALLIGYEIHDYNNYSFAIIDGDRLSADIAAQLGHPHTKGAEIGLFLNNEAEKDAFLRLMHEGNASPDNIKRLLTTFNRLNYIGQSLLISHAETLAQYPDYLVSTETDTVAQQPKE